MKNRVLHIWLYKVDKTILSHEEALDTNLKGNLHTCDVSLFNWGYLEGFDDIYIHWQINGVKLSTSLNECAEQKCPYLAKHIKKPTHDMLKIFFGSLYTTK